MRSPVALECARVAAGFMDSRAEVVLFQEDRAFVVASMPHNDLLQPRAPHSAEKQLRSDSRPKYASMDGWLALSIADRNGSPAGSLSVELGVTTGSYESTLAGLQALVRLIEAELSSDELVSPDFFRHVVNGQRDAVAILSSDMEITWASTGVTTLLGRTPQEMIGRPATDFIHPDDVERTFDAVIRMTQGLSVYRAHLRLLTPNGEYSPVEVTGNDLSDNPEIGGLVISIRDAQYGREQEVAGQRSEQRSNAILSSLRDGVIATDEFGSVVMINEIARAMFGIALTVVPAELRLADFVLESVEGQRHDPFDPNASENTTCQLVSPDGEHRFVTTAHRFIADEAGTELGQVVIFSDLTAEHRAAEELRTQAMHDQLTGLANRRQLDFILRKVETERPEIFVAACFIDLDNFKTVNDVHGHNTGDELVRIAADRLSAELGPEDLLVRQGGDEFVALLVDPDSFEEITEFAERCRQALASPYFINGQRHDVTGSIGISLAPAERVTSSDLLQQADMALYAAKDAGRNRVHYFDEALAVAVRSTEAKRKRLKRALEAEQLVMHFQPIVDTTTELTLGYEALARISTPVGVLPPSSFLEHLTSKSLMWDLDRAAFARSCNAAREFYRVSPEAPPFIACNFSSVSLNHPNFLTMLVDTVEQVDVPPSMISIELTESTAFEVGEAGRSKLEALTELGFKLVLDDFGTGYSSLSHIRDLPLSVLKVDRSFVTSLGTSSSERAIAEAIVRLADDLNFLVVAEGVETLEQLEQARSIGFNAIQGWYFSKALEFDEAIADWARTIDALSYKMAS